ncbi:MAG: hypothetical protein V1772_04545, partial [Chloroflexota bacterium]
MRLTIEAKAGALALQYKDTRQSLASVRPFIGPPYYPSEFEQREFDVQLEQRGARALVHMS